MGVYEVALGVALGMMVYNVMLGATLALFALIRFGIDSLKGDSDG